MLPWLADPETDSAAARSDLIAWAVGGLLWAVVTGSALGQPTGIVFGAALSLVLRRTLRLFVVF
jgi:hypothetical protein